jgi:hypothetical protein
VDNFTTKSTGNSAESADERTDIDVAVQPQRSLLNMASNHPLADRNAGTPGVETDGYPAVIRPTQFLISRPELRAAEAASRISGMRPQIKQLPTRN